MKNNTILKVIGGFFALVVVAILLIFLPAGSASLEKGWALMGLFFVPMLMVIAMLLSSSPDTLTSCFQINGPRPINKIGLGICGGLRWCSSC